MHRKSHCEIHWIMWQNWILWIADATPLENGKVNGHANGSVSDVAVKSDSSVSEEAKVESSPDKMEHSEEKASVLEVFRKVRLLGTSEDKKRKPDILLMKFILASLNVWNAILFFQIWVMAFCVTFVFTVTLSVFPAVTVDVKTLFPGEWGKSEPRWSVLRSTCSCLYPQGFTAKRIISHRFIQTFPLSSERYFISICCFLVFNLHDWFGRSITTLIHWVRIKQTVALLLWKTVGLIWS